MVYPQVLIGDRPLKNNPKSTDTPAHICTVWQSNWSS